MNEDYVSFETAKLLKEKGFNGLCTAYYDCFTTDNFHCGYEPTDFNSIDTKIRKIVAAPTLQMAMKWLREEKKIGIEVNTIFDLDDDNKWYYEYGFCILQLSGTYKKFAECDYDGYKTYEEACEEAIRYTLENLI